jgi:hypothetical protein
MDATQIITVVSLIVSPASALAAVWLTSNLATGQRRREQEDRARADALSALGHLAAVYADAMPSLVYNGDLREYTSPEDAIKGLYARWNKAREPMMVLNVSHPSAEVRDLAFGVQGELEVVLRLTDDAIKSQGSLDRAEHMYHQCGQKFMRLGGLLSSFGHNKDSSKSAKNKSNSVE